jgi:hypothetical protein
MGKTAATWTDARLDDFADALAPLPAEVAMLKATVSHWDHVAAAFEPVPAEVATLKATVNHWEHVAAALEPVPGSLTVLTAAVERLTDENRALRAELAATQRQLLQIAWGLVAALVGAAAALVSVLV